MWASNKKVLWWTSYWRGENQTRQPPQFSYLRAADTIGSVTDYEVSILTSLEVFSLLSLAAYLFLRQRVTFLGSILPSLLLLKVFRWLFLILGFRQKSYAGFPTFSPIFLVNLILQLPNGLPVHASTRVPRQSLGMCWSIVLVLALFFSESDTLSLGVRHWLNKAAS